MTVTQPVVDLDVEVRPAVPDDAEGIVAVYDRAYGGRYTVRALTDPAGVRRLIEDRRRDWILAVAGDRVVGTVLARPDLTDGRYETCGVAVDPEYQGRARVPTLLSRVVEAVLERPDCELVYSYVRSEGVRRAVTWTRAGLRWTGTDGGLHRPGAEREEHLFGLFLNRARPFTRVTPARSVLVPDSALAQEVSALEVLTRVGPYPSTLAARSAVGWEYEHESAWGRLRYAVDQSARAVEVDSVEVDGVLGVLGVRRLLEEVVDGAGPWPVEHLTINVLADKPALIAELCRPDARGPGRRFTAVGYRPGWHQQDGDRYDCVTLTARLDPRTPLSHGLGGRIAAVRAGLDPERVVSY